MNGQIHYSFFIYFLFLSDEGPMLETLDYTIRIGSIPTFLYFDLYLYSAYAAHFVYLHYRDKQVLKQVHYVETIYMHLLISFVSKFPKRKLMRKLLIFELSKDSEVHIVIKIPHYI